MRRRGGARNKHVQQDKESSGDTQSEWKTTATTIARRRRIAETISIVARASTLTKFLRIPRGSRFREASGRHYVEERDRRRAVAVTRWRQRNYYAIPPSRPTQLGISPQAVQRQTGVLVDRVSTRYVLTEDVEVLRSTAAAIGDTWSVPGKTIAAEDGGTQMFSAMKQVFRRN